MLLYHLLIILCLMCLYQIKVTDVTLGKSKEDIEDPNILC